MSTTQDVRIAFRTLADHAPTEIDLEAFTVAAPRPRRRVRAMLAVGGAVAAVVAAVVVAAAVGSHRPASPPGGPSVTPPSIPLRVWASVDGQTSALTQVSATYQDLELASGPMVRVFVRGAFNPATDLDNAKAVNVHGHRGYVGKLRLDGSTVQEWMDVPHYKGLAWQYAPDSWAFLNTGYEPPDSELLNAQAKVGPHLRVHGSAALKLPFRLGYLPAGLAVTSASTSPQSPVNEGVISFSRGRLNVIVNRQGLDDAVPHCSGTGSKRVTVHGYPGCFRDDNGVGGGRRLELAIPGGWLTLQIDSEHPVVYSDAALKRIAAAVTLAPKLDDASTWFDARTVLPR